MIAFIVPTVPVAQPRQRHRIVKPRQGKEFVQNYTESDHPVQTFKDYVQLAARQAYQGDPMKHLFFFRGTFVMPRPQRLCRKKDDPGRLYFGSAPDHDNLAKAVCDALNGMIWVDDSQIVRSLVSKFYAARDEQPCCEIEIEVIQ